VPDIPDRPASWGYVMRIDKNRLVTMVSMAAAALVVTPMATLAVTPVPSLAAAPPDTPVDAPRPVFAGIDLESATVIDLQTAMNERRLSSTRLTDFYLRRIAALNPRLRAVIETNPSAPADAAASDARRAGQGARSALEGIPVLLKDNVDTADREHSTAGSFALVDSTPARDAFLVSRLRSAGAVVLGKANLSEWANFRSTRSISGWSARGGQTHNPYVLNRNPCGSSSGSGVGASAHLATVAIGTETDGSIMCPSGVNGVVGIKPTLGLVSRTGVVPISAKQDTAGPMTRTVTDAAAVLSVVQGVDASDPATAPAGPFVGRDYLRSLNPDALRGKRIGVWRSAAGGNADAVRVLNTTVATLRARGATIVDNVTLNGLDPARSNEFPALLNEFKHDINAYLAARPGPHPANLAGLIAFNNAHADVEMPLFRQEIFEMAQQRSGNLNDPTYVRQRTTATNAARNAIDNALAANRLDAILAPTSGSAGPPAIGGYPNLSVPGGFSRGVLPIGVSFFGGRWSEPTLIAFAFAFEQASKIRRPPTFRPTL
jgi:amidase